MVVVVFLDHSDCIVPSSRGEWGMVLASVLLNLPLLFEPLDRLDYSSTCSPTNFYPGPRPAKNVPIPHEKFKEYANINPRVSQEIDIDVHDWSNTKTDLCRNISRGFKLRINPGLCSCSTQVSGGYMYCFQARLDTYIYLELHKELTNRACEK